MFGVDCSADERVQGWVGTTAREVYACFGEIADAGREPESEKMRQGEDVVGESGGVGVMLGDAEVGFVVEKPVEYIGCVADADVDEGGMEGRVLVGDMGVDQAPRSGTVFWVDVAGAFGSVPGFEALPVRG